jgi:nitroimidazol reductase NimA-like FMN-containing flavoprotein (pyridoxamine 5'-phosphate oxidase superfamily)
MSDCTSTNSVLQPTPRTTLKRLPARGRFEREAVNAILDEGLICHAGFVVEGQPYVVPTIHARQGRRLVIHGSAASRMLRTLAGGVPACVTVTLLDGLVLARSAFHHSMNYRSVMVLGTAVEVTDPAEKDAALSAIVEHVMRGRSAAVRPPTPLELKATSVLALPIDEASAKVRTGPPVDDEEDYVLPVWAGVLPLALVPGPPVADPRLPEGIALPGNIASYTR